MQNQRRFVLLHVHYDFLGPRDVSLGKERVKHFGDLIDEAW